MRKELMRPVFLLLAVGVSVRLPAQLPAGWTSQDMGNPAAAGSAAYEKGTETWTIRGDGTGIRGTADQFHFVYKALSGDGELVARVVSLDPPVDDWSMAGVMIRVLLIPGSPYVFMGISANTDTRDHGITFWGREAINGPADHESTGDVTGPYWVKVKRSGDTFSGYSSSDGREWIERYSTTAAGIPASIYIGYAVTSNAAGKLVTAVFDRGPMKASNPEPADGARNVATPLLMWTPGVTAVSHDVYLGTSPTLGQAEFMGRLPIQPAMYFHTPGFIPGTTYYWRVDEVAAGGTVYPGDVWRFTSAPATAYAPQPWDGLDGVPVETDLAWNAGAGAVSHDVYFGTDKALVKAGDPSVFQGNRMVMLYDPGALDGGTTYYWRIDEHDAGDVVHPGAVWSFTTVGPGLGVRAEYFSGLDPWGTPVLTRVEDTIDHGWGSGEIAAGLSDGVSARWTTNLEAPFTETYQLITTSDDGVRLWLDGRRLIDNWTNHGGTDDVATVELIAGQFYRVQMEWYENTGSATARLSWQSPSVGKQVIPAGPLQLPLRAAGPYPAHLSTDVSQTLTLAWMAGTGAVQHHVYFADDAEAVAEAAPGGGVGREVVDEPTFDPGPLEWNKTYYWRVDEVNDADAGSPWQGVVWSFITADFLVVDDFESYTDDEGGRIYETWIDGYTSGSNGSTVGYIEAPFAEQTIVHGGGQSMPLDYDNANAPYYSEAEREFLPVQDWTVNGVDTLVLHVRGRPGNDAALLYVRLENSTGKAATVMHADAAIVQTPTWTAWRIPLSEFTAAGVNVTKVGRMYIGLGDKTNPAPDGQGLIFIDDIRVVKPGM